MVSKVDIEHATYHWISSNMRRSRSPRTRFTFSAHTIRPSRWARKSGWLARFSACGPFFAQLCSVAFNRVVAGARQVEMIVDDQAGHALATAAPHDAGLAMVQGIAFGVGDVFDGGEERFDPAREALVAGEGEIVGVAGVVGVK